MSPKDKYFLPEYNLFFADLKRDVLHRSSTASAWLDKNADKPAPPLPPVERIEISPIKKIEKFLDID
jgi:hypothetical protein